jgi:multicomponent Na+:H+ antiporter subunit D
MNLLSLPIVIPLLSAVLCLLFKNSLSKQRIISVTALTIHLSVSIFLLLGVKEQGYFTLNSGGWESSIGIVLVVDILSCIMLVVTAFIALCVLVYSFKEIELKIQSRFFYPLFNFLILGVNGAFITGDIFNLYVWFEIMLLSSFILLVIGKQPDQLEGAIKYVLLNLFSSFLFLIGVGILYAKVGSLNLADIAQKISQDPSGSLLNTTGVIFLVAFGFKAAVFPFFFWLPASYHTPPTAISALFAGLLTKVGVYALIRIFTLIFIADSELFKSILIVIALLTMTIGALCAASQFEIRKILSVHIVSQIGYMVLGLAIFTPLAIAGAIFCIIHNILVKTNLFLISGLILKHTKTTDLNKSGGLYKSYPFLSVLFCLTAFSLAGIPPFSGFWAKLSILKAAVESEMYICLIVGLAVGVITLFSMTKIWSEAFWKDKPVGNSENTEKKPFSLFMILPIVAMTASALILGLFGETVFITCMQSAEQLLNPSGYIDAVLGGLK